MDDATQRFRNAIIVGIMGMIVLFSLFACLLGVVLSDIASAIRAIPTPNATPITVNVEPAGPAINIYPGPTVETPQWINP